MSNLPSIIRTIGRDIVIYEEFEENLIPVFKPAQYFTEQPITILVDNHEADRIENFRLISNPDLISKTYTCRVSQNCSYQTSHLGNFKRHVEKCAEISKQKIEGKLKPYGVESNIVTQLVDLGYLPTEAKTFRKTFFCAFDIESLEDKTHIAEMRNVEGVHKLASISIACNDGRKFCFVRRDSSHEATIELIHEFVTKIRQIEQDHDLILPDYFNSCVDKIEEDLNDESIPKKKRMLLSSLQSKVKSYLCLDIYGFNSGKVK